MKAYTIKPLEWEEFPHINRLQCHPYTIRTDYHEVQLICSLLFVEPMTFETIEAAKAKAQELHEAELMKHLQECHSLSHGDANLSVSTPLEAGSAQNGVDTP